MLPSELTWGRLFSEGWALKNWCFQTVALEETLASPLDSKKIKPANPKGNQPWIFIERTEAEAEAPLLWPPDMRGQHIGKDPDAGKDWGQGEKGTTEDEVVGWHHRLNGHESEQTLEDSRQGSLACCISWSRRVRHYWATGQNQRTQLIQQSLYAPWWLKMVKSHHLGHYLSG